ncbi:MAG: proline--tRNA ligase, partial [Clostridia bacterium]
KDRTGHDMLLGMTHEEAAVHACRNFVKSYDQLPFMIYQIQTKFRDEARARAGLIRVKEFTMKDAYSFHETQEDLNEYYYKQLDAYNRIFSRIGMKNFVSVKSDTGMMGGNVAHEFMLLTEIGEDSIAICDNCDYRANVEVAAGILDLHETKVEELKEVFTGDAKDIAEICSILNVEPWQTCKAVSYAIKGDEKKSVLAFVRGDLEVNESKLKNLVGAEVAPKDLSNDEELLAGNIGPVGLKLCDTIVVFDKSLEQCASLVCGANKPKMHYVGFNIERDYGVVEFSDITKVKDLEVCKICGKGHLHIKRGIEIGNIFNLGNKYTKSMNMTVHGRDGKEFNPIMGCYGIGVGRALASVVEESCDEKGL